MRRLGRGAAKRCEEATEPKCRCRCGGALHGAKRGSTDSLPLGDPHSTKRERCAYSDYYRCGRPAIAEIDGQPRCDRHAESQPAREGA